MITNKRSILVAAFLTLSMNTAQATEILIECGNRAGEGVQRSSYGFASRALVPEQAPGAPTALFIEGVENYKVSSVNTLINKEQGLAGYAVVEKGEVGFGAGHRTFVFSELSDCNKNSKPAQLQILYTDQVNGQRAISPVIPCVCYIELHRLTFAKNDSRETQKTQKVFCVFI
jgi:hypothetical protein